jgi:hypothetical protein
MHIMSNQDSTSATVNGQVGTPAPAADAPPVRGRSVFMVDTAAMGIVVRTAFLAEDNRVAEMPAVFPDLTYALAQIDSLRQIVIERFAQAAQVGAQVLAARAAEAGGQSQVSVTAAPAAPAPAAKDPA